MPFGPRNLHDIFRGPSAITTKQAEEIITHGKASMPAWGAVLTHSDIDAVIDYLKMCKRLASVILAADSFEIKSRDSCMRQAFSI
jgi:hypothetical protein